MTRCSGLHGECEIKHDLACTLIVACDFLYMGLNILKSSILDECEVKHCAVWQGLAGFHLCVLSECPLLWFWLFDPF